MCGQEGERISVLKSKRKESTVAFVSNALDLEVYTIKQCIKLPKRYTFLIINEVVDLTKRVYNLAKLANSIYPKDNESVSLRHTYIKEAMGHLQCFISQIDVLHELLLDTVGEKVWLKWLELAANEQQALENIIKSDNRRIMKP